MTNLAFHLDWSISKHVGLTWWSAALFLVFLIIVAVIFWNWSVRNRVMSAFLKVILVLWVVVGLCPYGLFNDAVTMAHQIVARTMFVLMFMYNIYGNRGVWRWIFAAYGLFCGVTSIFFPWIFWPYNFVWEVIYLGGFFALIIGAGRDSR